MMGAAARRHRRHANPFTLRGIIEVPDWQSIFSRQAPMALDVGCGAGLFVQQLAQLKPQLNVVGMEIRQHLVDAALARVRLCALPNGYALVANANAHLKLLFSPRSIAFVSLNFPDPWYKKRHQKRRVLQPAWLEDLLPILSDGAHIHAMTDYLPLAEHMRHTLDACPALRCVHSPHLFAPSSTTGLQSEREMKHLARGEPIYRLQYVYELGKRYDGRANIGATQAQCYTSNRAHC